MTAAQKLQAAQQLAAPLGLTEAALLHLLQHPSSPEYVRSATGISAANETKIANLAANLNLGGGITETMSTRASTPTARRPPTWSGSPTSTRSPT